MANNDQEGIYIVGEQNIIHSMSGNWKQTADNLWKHSSHLFPVNSCGTATPTNFSPQAVFKSPAADVSV